jgi:hypothetical protein
MCIERKGTGKCLDAGRKIQRVYGNTDLVKRLCLTECEICESTFRTGHTIYAYRTVIGKHVANFYSDDR